MRLKGTQNRFTVEVDGPIIRIKATPQVGNSNKAQLLINKIKSQRQSEVISKAIDFASIAHEGQYRRIANPPPIPYIVHPLTIAINLIKHNCSDEVVAAAILHDTIEDTKITYEQIEQNFGREVADLVSYVTELDKTHLWEERKGRYIEHLKSAPLDAIFISCADKLDNIRSLKKSISRWGELAWLPYSRPRADQKQFFHSLVDVYESRLSEDTTGNFKELFDMFKAEVEKVFSN